MWVRGRGAVLVDADGHEYIDGLSHAFIDEQVGARIHAHAVTRGLFSRVRGDTFVLAPPFVIDDDLLDRIAAVLADATRAVLS